MKQFDLEKLEKAIIYSDRMAEGRNPYSNQPVDNEVLNNPNVIRSMYFIKEVLQAVKANGGIIGGRKNKSADADKFPFEVLERFKYQENKPVSQVLKQFVEISGDSDISIISATSVNKWLAANGYIVKAVINSEGRESWLPTEKGIAMGLSSEQRGEPGREYIRIEYNKDAQEFLAKNLKRITEETLADNNR